MYVYLESPWRVLESGYHFPVPGVDDSSHEGPGRQHSSVSYNFGGLSSCISPPPPPSAFEVGTGNQPLRKLQPFQEFSVSECFKHYQTQKGSGLWWYNITLDLGDTGKKKEKTEETIWALFIVSQHYPSGERVFVNEFNPHTLSSVLCLGSDNPNSRRHTTSRSFSLMIG